MHTDSAPSGAPLPRTAADDLAFHWLLDRLPAAAYTCDAEGLITYFNARAKGLWGRAPALLDPMDRYCGSFKLFAPDGAAIPHDRCWMALALREGVEHNGREIVIERPDGTRWTALAHANPYRDEAGEVRGAVNVLVDITERKRHEELLREADRNKNEFLAMLSHELRNPLAPLRNGLHILRLAGSDAAVSGEACNMMERQLGHMVRLIDDLLDLSRITRGKIELKRERMDLLLALRDAIEASRPQVDTGGHELVVHLPPRALFVHGDRTRLAQVFSNLLINSAKYTPPGGRIELTADRHGTDVVVRVRDNGIGIEPELLSRVFDLYSQGQRRPGTAPAGLGIGLALVRGLIEMHGGRVEARSDGPGCGSEFTVRLSAVVPPGEAHDPPAPGLASGDVVSTYRLLVVDDNVDAAVSLALMLRLMGHESRTAGDGDEAVRAYDAFSPDVVLLDLGLPGLSGYEVCHAIRERPGGERPVLIALTGSGQEDDKQRSKDAGFNFHMVKPVDPQALQKLLSGLLLTPS